MRWGLIAVIILLLLLLLAARLLTYHCCHFYYCERVGMNTAEKKKKKKKEEEEEEKKERKKVCYDGICSSWGTTYCWQHIKTQLLSNTLTAEFSVYSCFESIQIRLEQQHRTANTHCAWRNVKLNKLTSVMNVSRASAAVHYRHLEPICAQIMTCKSHRQTYKLLLDVEPFKSGSSRWKIGLFLRDTSLCLTLAQVFIRSSYRDSIPLRSFPIAACKDGCARR